MPSMLPDGDLHDPVCCHHTCPRGVRCHRHVWCCHDPSCLHMGMASTAPGIACVRHAAMRSPPSGTPAATAAAQRQRPGRPNSQPGSFRSPLAQPTSSSHQQAATHGSLHPAETSRHGTKQRPPRGNTMHLAKNSLDPTDVFGRSPKVAVTQT